MGKTGTTNEFRDALFVGSTYGPQGITVAVRIGFDDDRPLGEKETGARAALPIFREIMLRVYQDGLVGPAPQFPREIEEGIDGVPGACRPTSQASMRTAADACPHADDSGRAGSVMVREPTTALLMLLLSLPLSAGSSRRPGATTRPRCRT